MVGALAGVIAGGVVAVAGAAKLVDRAHWKASARQMKVPPVLALVLPWVECAVGAAVVARIAVPWTALVLGVFLLGFTTVLAVSMRLESPPVCACFGRFSTRVVGWRDMARNAVLIAATMVVIVAG